MLSVSFWFLVGWLSLPLGSSPQSSSSTRILLFTRYIYLCAWCADLRVHRTLFQGSFGYLFLGNHDPYSLVVPQAVARACALFKDQYPLIMAIPYSNRTGVIIIPELALRDKPALLMAEIHQDLFKVIPKDEFVQAVCCVQYMGRSRLHITFASPDRMEDIIHRGITIRGHPVKITPITTKKWVRVSRVPFGIPLASVQQALHPYGDYFVTKHETLNNVPTGEISVLMNIKSPIPSKLSVAGRPCIAWYYGQRQTCYLCNCTDHRANNCPKRRARATNAPTFASVTAGPKPLSPRSILTASGGNPPHQDLPVPSTPIHTPVTQAGPSSLPLPGTPEPPPSAEFSQSEPDHTTVAHKSPVFKKARTTSHQEALEPQSTQSPILESPILGCNTSPFPEDPSLSPAMQSEPEKEAMDVVSTSKKPKRRKSKIPGPPKPKLRRRGMPRQQPYTGQTVLRRSSRPQPGSASTRKHLRKRGTTSNRFSILSLDPGSSQSEDTTTFKVTASGNIHPVSPPRPRRTIPNHPFPVSGSESK